MHESFFHGTINTLLRKETKKGSFVWSVVMVVHFILLTPAGGCLVGAGYMFLLKILLLLQVQTSSTRIQIHTNQHTLSLRLYSTVFFFPNALSNPISKVFHYLRREWLGSLSSRTASSNATYLFINTMMIFAISNCSKQIKKAPKGISTISRSLPSLRNRYFYWIVAAV
jgi:hypothetical protein